MPPPRVGQVTPGSGQLRGAWSTTDITPRLGEFVAGWGPHPFDATATRSSFGRLHLRVLLLEDPTGGRLALAVADLHGGSRVVLEKTALRLEVVALGLSAPTLWLIGTHTHSGPGHIYGNTFYDDNAAQLCGYDEAYVDRLVDQMSACLVDAAGRLEPVKLAYGCAPCWGWSRNRSFLAFRENFPDHHFPTFDGHAPPVGLESDRAVIDPRVHVLRVDATADAPGGARLLGAVATFGAHGTVVPLEAGLLGSDWFGPAAREAARLLDGPGPRPCIAIAPSSIGDTDPCTPDHDRNKAHPWDRPAEFMDARVSGVSDGPEASMALATKIGEAIGAVVAQATRDATPIDVADLVVRYIEPIAAGATWGGTPFDVLARHPRIGAPTVGGSELGPGVRTAATVEGTRWSHKKLNDPQWPKRISPLPQILTIPPGWFNTLWRRVPLRFARVGSLAFVGIPGEPTTTLCRAIEARVKEADPAVRAVMIYAVAGDYLGYWTTEPEYKTQHYEGSSTVWGRNAGTWLLRQVERLALGANDTEFDADRGLWRNSNAPPSRKLRRTADLPDDHALHWTPRRHAEDPRRLQLVGGWVSAACAPLPSLGPTEWIVIEARVGGQITPLVVDGIPVDDAAWPFLLRAARPKALDASSLVWSWSADVTLAQSDEPTELRARFVGPSEVAPEGAAVTDWWQV